MNLLAQRDRFAERALVLPRDDLPGSFFTELADTIEESTIPYDVDLVDLREVGSAFREEVLRTGIKWRD